MTRSEQFFYRHAGYCYGPGETPKQGRERCARSLARAERWATRNGLSFHWEIDPFADSSEFNDDPEPWQLWACVCRGPRGRVLASLCGIDFGRDGEPWGDNYRRVVQAELASEARGAVATA